jgi:hypothetical protein
VGRAYRYRRRWFRCAFPLGGLRRSGRGRALLGLPTVEMISQVCAGGTANVLCILQWRSLPPPTAYVRLSVFVHPSYCAILTRSTTLSNHQHQYTSFKAPRSNSPSPSPGYNAICSTLRVPLHCNVTVISSCGNLLGSIKSLNKRFPGDLTSPPIWIA